MGRLRTSAEFLILMLVCNAVPLFTVTDDAVLRWVIIAAAAVIWLVLRLSAGNNKPDKERKKLKKLQRSTEFVGMAGFAAVAEVIVLCLYFSEYSPDILNIVFSIIIPVLVIALLLARGIFGISVNSKQIKLSDYILLLSFWWLPIVNIFLFRRFYKTAKREYIFESDRLEFENARAENEICKTKYPVLMVHGIFFRDWQYFNYWGRIPAALIRNGATICYGKQQSASSVERSAEELKERIFQVIEETGAEKVNIIAHSKGGLDSRYAVSCLGMDKYTASLTTINTPHKGCDMVDLLLDKAPKGFVEFLTSKYNSIYGKLGDDAPDFLAGVNDLRASRAERFNSEVTDSPDVLYMSRMTVMKSAMSAFFPLGAAFLLIKKLNGDNDGLVSADSAVHGEHKLIAPKKRRGISHGDVIDLMRENIDGYDVREFYVDILKELKERGL